MELECPQCSKRLHVSAEELLLHGGAVVCPQCLAVFDAGDKVPEGTVASRSGRVTEEHLSYAYCPHCGRKIPEGVNYCPYCGQELAAAGHDSAAATEPLTAQPADDTNAPAADGDKHTEKRSHREHRSEHRSERGHSSSGSHRSSSQRSSSSNKQWQPVMPSYRYAKTVGWHSGAQKASPLFAAIAWLVIAALLALLAFIIHKVNMLT